MIDKIKEELATAIVNEQGEMSQREFAKLLGENQSDISRFANKRLSRYSLEYLLRVASLLDINFSYKIEKGQ